MIKRFHYFKPENKTNGFSTLDLLPTDSPDSTSSRVSNSSTCEGDYEMYNITYKVSSAQPPIKIQVPFHFTVFQDQHKTFTGSREEKSPEKGNKIRVFLIGNEHCPDLSPLVQATIPVDRIEFQGNIRYEKPIFEMIHQLKHVRKVKFFIGTGQTLEYFEGSEPEPAESGSEAKSRTKNGETTEQEQILTQAHKKQNLSVTTLAIRVSKKLHRKLIKDRESTTSTPSTLGETSGEREEKLLDVIESMVVRILKKSALAFPNLRKLTVDTPNSMVKVLDVVTVILGQWKYLKTTVVDLNEDKLLVTKAPEEEIITEIDAADDSQEEAVVDLGMKEAKFVKSEVNLTLDKDEIIEQAKELMKEEEEEVTVEVVSKEEEECISISLSQPEQESQEEVVKSPPANNNLDHYSKMLESMLGIGGGALSEAKKLAQK